VTHNDRMDSTAQPPIATGWLLWLTWLFVIGLALTSIGTAIALVFGPDAVARALGIGYRAPDVTVWWGIQQVAYVSFGVACVGVLLRDRDFASFAVVMAWSIAVLQCIDAALQIFHLRLSLPIGVVLYVAFAIKMSMVLRAEAAPAPPGSGGML
jgi:hypothetical protein